MKKNKEGGRSVYKSARMCVVYREDGSLLIGDVPERNPEGGPAEPLRLIGHSNVTGSLPNRLGGDTWPREWEERSLWREEMEQRV